MIKIKIELDGSVTEIEYDLYLLPNGETIEIETGKEIPEGAIPSSEFLPKLKQKELQTQRVAEIKSELLKIDSKTARAVREFFLSGDKTRLIELESQAVELRKELVSLTDS